MFRLPRFQKFAFASTLALGTLSTLAGGWLLFAGPRENRLVPTGYELRSAAEKQAILWDEFILPTRYESDLPKLSRVNPLEFIFSALQSKMSNQSDFAPVGYNKPIHAHGVIAKVRYEAVPGTPYSGLFQGAENGFLRASLTADPASMPVAPGLALKLLVDGKPSQNISVLYKLSGQDQDHNFFAHELSNIIPLEMDPKSIFSSAIFLRASKHPNKVSVKAFARVNAAGESVMAPVSPVQIYFVPVLPAADSAPHDFRRDFLALDVGTILYDVYATQEEGNDFLKIDEDRRSRAVKIGSLLQDSEFVASAFADSALFFKHDDVDDDPR